MDAVISSASLPPSPVLPHVVMSEITSHVIAATVTDLIRPSGGNPNTVLNSLLRFARTSCWIKHLVYHKLVELHRKTRREVYEFAKDHYDEVLMTKMRTWPSKEIYAIRMAVYVDDAAKKAELNNEAWYLKSRLLLAFFVKEQLECELGLPQRAS